MEKHVIGEVWNQHLVDSEYQQSSEIKVHVHKRMNKNTQLIINILDL